MNIKYLELLTKDLVAQRDYYSQVLELPVSLAAERLEVQAGTTTLVFTQAQPDFDDAYHFAFNIPENQFSVATDWISARIPLLHDEIGKFEFDSAKSLLELSGVPHDSEVFAKLRDYRLLVQEPRLVILLDDGDSARQRPTPSGHSRRDLWSGAG